MADESLLSQKQQIVAAASDTKQAALDPVSYAQKQALSSPAAQRLMIGTDTRPAAPTAPVVSAGDTLAYLRNRQDQNLGELPYTVNQQVSDLPDRLMSGAATTLGTLGQQLPAFGEFVGSSLNTLDGTIKNAIATPVSAEDRALGLGAPQQGSIGDGLLDGFGQMSRDVSNATQWLKQPWDERVSRRGQINDAQQQQRAQAEQTRLNKQHDQDIANGDSSFMAGLKDIGRGVMSQAKDYANNPSTILSDTVENLPQLGATLLTGGRSLAGNVISSAGMEAASQVDQVNQDLSQISDNQLLQQSAKAQDLANQGYDMQSIRNIIAGQAGGQAAGEQFAGTLATAPLGARFEISLLGNHTANSSRERLMHRGVGLAGEGLDEAANSATGQLSVNNAENQNFDPSVNLTQGVGQSITQGGVTGIGMSAVASAPQTVADTAAITAQQLNPLARLGIQGLSQAGQAVSDLAERRTKAAADRQGVSEDQANAQSNVDAATEDLNTTPTAEPTSTVNAFDPTAEASLNQLNATIDNSAARLKSAYDAIKSGLLTPEQDRDYRVYASDQYSNLVDRADAINNTLNDGSLSDSDKATLQTEKDNIIKVLAHTPYKDLYDSTEHIPDEEFDAAQERLPSTQDLNITPEVQAAINTVKRVAQTDPTRVTPDQYQSVLDNDQTLSDAQRSNLEQRQKVSVLNQSIKQKGNLGSLADSNEVSDNVRNNTVGDFKSVPEHVQGILNSIGSNNYNRAQSQLDDLGKFAQNYQDRAQAYNDTAHYLTESGQTSMPLNQYKQLRPNTRTDLSDSSQFVNLKGNGKQHIDNVISDANHVAEVYNNILEATPGLTGTAIPTTETTYKQAKFNPEVAQRVQRNQAANPVPQAEPTPATAQTQQAEPVEDATSSYQQYADQFDSQAAEQEQSTPTVEEPAQPEVQEQADTAEPETQQVLPNGYTTRDQGDGTHTLERTRNGSTQYLNTNNEWVNGKTPAPSRRPKTNTGRSPAYFTRDEAAYTARLLDDTTPEQEAENETVAEANTQMNDAAESLESNYSQEAADSYSRAAEERNLVKQAKVSSDVVSDIPEATNEGVTEDVTQDAVQPVGTESSKGSVLNDLPTHYNDVAGDDLNNRNPLVHNFSYKKGMSKLADNPEIMQQLNDALNSDNPAQAVSEMFESDYYKNLTSDEINGIKQVIDLSNQLATSINDQAIAMAKATPSMTKGRSLYTALTSRKTNTPMSVGKFTIASIYRMNGSNLEVHPAIAQAMALASLDAVTGHISFMNNSDTEELAKKIKALAPNLSNEQVSTLSLNQETKQFMDNTISTDALAKQLGRSVNRFLGIKANNNASESLANTVTETIGKNLIEMLVADNVLIRVEAPNIIKQTIGKTPVGYRLNKSTAVETKRRANGENVPEYALDSILGSIDATRPNLLTDLFTPASSSMPSLDKPITAVRETVKGTVGQYVTPAQLAQLKNEQATPYLRNTPMVELSYALGKNNHMRIAGADLYANTDNTNREDMSSLEGRYQGANFTYDRLMAHDRAVLNQSSDTGTAPEKVGTYLKSYIGSNDRMMVSSSTINPQSYKDHREMYTRSNTTFGLDNQDALDGTYLHIAQAIGVKTDKIPNADAIAQAKAELASNPAYTRAVEILRAHADDLLSMPEDAANELTELLSPMTAAVADNQFHKLHALLTHARLENAIANGDSEFTHALSFELDGITDGPINAVVHNGITNFNDHFITTAGKGGVYFNDNSTAVNTQVNRSPDLYQTSSDEGKVYIKDTPSAVAMSYFTDVTGVSTKETDGVRNIEISRNLFKKPVTQTFYNAGMNSIISKIATDMINNLYTQVTNAYRTGTPLDSNMVQALGEIIDIPNQSLANLLKGDLKQFRVPDQMVTNLISTMIADLGEPITNAIHAAVGHTTMNNMRMQLQASQVANVMYQAALQREEARMQEQRVNEGVIRPQDSISPADYQEVIRRAAPFATSYGTAFSAESNNPAIQQNIGTMNSSTEYVPPKQKTPVRTESLKGRMQSPISLARVDKNIGVRFTALRTIGTGDGSMMTRMGQDSRNALNVFDGYEVPVHDRTTLGKSINEAVYEGYRHNTIRDVVNQLESTINNMDTLDNQDIYDNIPSVTFNGVTSKQLRLDTVSDKPITTAEGLRNAVVSLHAQLSQQADRVDATMEVLHNEVPMSIDHMGGAESPHIVNEDIQPIDNVVDYVNRRVDEILQSKKSTAQLASETNTQLNQAMLSNSSLNSYGTHTLTGTDTYRALETTDEFKSNKPLSFALSNIMNSMPESVRVHFGSAADINSMIRSKYPEVSFNNDALGHTIGNEVFIKSNNVETVAHELIHAGIQTRVNDTYNGTAPSLMQSYVRSIELEMNSFMNSSTLRDTIPSSVQATIGNYLANNNKAAAVNEFIAWGLTNENMQDLLLNRPMAQNSPWRRGFTRILDAVMRILGLPKGRTAYNALAGLAFSTVQVARQPAYSTDTTDMSPEVLNQALNSNGSTEHETHLNNVFNKVNSLLASKMPNLKYFKDDAMAPLVESGYATGIVQSLSEFKAAGFVSNPKEAQIFGYIQAAFAANLQMDTRALNQAQRLFENAIKTLRYTDFMENPLSQEPSDIAEAQAKLATVTGTNRTTVFKTKEGLSNHLANFVALAATDKNFRNVLSNISQPVSKGNTAGTMAARIENSVNDAMASVGNKLVGITPGMNTSEAVDVVINKIAHVNSQAKRSAGDLVEQYRNDAENLIKQKLYKPLNTAAANVVQSTVDRQLAGNASALDNFKGFAALIARSMTNENDNTAVEAALGLVSKTKTKWARELMQEVIGTTGTNYNVFKFLNVSKAAVARIRQSFREQTTKIVNGRFSRELTNAEHSLVHKVVAKADIQSLTSSYSYDDIHNLVSDANALNTAVATEESAINGDKHAAYFKQRAKELAHYMLTEDNQSDHLLRNAFAIGSMFGTNTLNKPSQATVNTIDRLTSLYALQQLSPEERESMAGLMESERNAISPIINHLGSLVQREQANLNDLDGAARLNAYKGYIPTSFNSRMDVQIADPFDGEKLIRMGYVAGEPIAMDKDLNSSASLRYYYNPEGKKATFNQGALQIIEPSAYGIDAVTGRSMNLVGSEMIRDKRTVSAIKNAKQSRINNAAPTKQSGNLMPVFNAKGSIVGYEQSVPAALRDSRMNANKNLGDLLGIWEGRQVEQQLAVGFNNELINTLADTYNREKATRADEYVDIANSADPAVKEAWNLLPRTAKAALKDAFGDKVMVRSDMINNVIGYRNPSVRELFDNSGNVTPKTQKAVQDVAVALLGPSAAKYLIQGERYWQSAISTAKEWIIIRSVTVGVRNAIGNVHQLAMNGIPLTRMPKLMAQKYTEVTTYRKNANEVTKLSVLRSQITDPLRQAEIDRRIQRLNDANNRLSIAPLIAAGELPSIAEGLTVEDDNALRQDFGKWMESVVDKIPKEVKTPLRYAMMGQGTPIYDGLDAMITYGDFIAKSVLYEHKTKNQNMSNQDALREISDEFVNYTLLPGRTRSYLESMGATWFLNYKLRIQKIIMRNIRKNPLGALMYTTTMSPLGVDNIFDAFLPTTSWGYTLAPNPMDSVSRIMQAPTLHPLTQLMQ